MNPNRVRDHLANERTYLAWIRTAVALMGFGLVIVRMRYFLPLHLQGQAHGWELGLWLTALGLGTVVLCTLHYFAVREAIESDQYEPGHRWIVIFSIAVGLIGAGLLYFLFTSPADAVPAAPGALGPVPVP